MKSREMALFQSNTDESSNGFLNPSRGFWMPLQKLKDHQNQRVKQYLKNYKVFNAYYLSALIALDWSLVAVDLQVLLHVTFRNEHL